MEIHGISSNLWNFNAEKKNPVKENSYGNWVVDTISHLLDSELAQKEYEKKKNKLECETPCSINQTWKHYPTLILIYKADHHKWKKNNKKFSQDQI